MSLGLRLPRKNTSMQILFKCPTPDKTPRFAHFWQVHNPLRLPRETTCERPISVNFYTFDFETRFTPQRRALFWHVNFQKQSDTEVFCTFWLGNVLRAAMSCTFPHLNVQKCSDLGVFCTFWLSWTFVLRAISHLARWLCTRRFSEPTFRPSGVTNHWKNTALCDFATFLRTCIFCLMPLSLLWSSFFFSSLLFSDSSHLCFFICP